MPTHFMPDAIQICLWRNGQKVYSAWTRLEPDQAKTLHDNPKPLDRASKSITDPLDNSPLKPDLTLHGASRF